MSDQTADTEPPAKQPASPNSRVLRRAALWGLLGALIGVAAGLIVGTTLSFKAGLSTMAETVYLAVEHAILMGLFGGVFVGGVALLEGWFRKPNW